MVNTEGSTGPANNLKAALRKGAAFFCFKLQKTGSTIPLPQFCVDSKWIPIPPLVPLRAKIYRVPSHQAMR